MAWQPRWSWGRNTLWPRRLSKVADFAAVTGVGVRGTVGGKAVALGNAAMMRQMALDMTVADAKADNLRANGQTARFVAVDGALAGIVAVATR